VTDHLRPEPSFTSNGITRRSALGLLGAAGAVAAGASLSTACQPAPTWTGVFAIGSAYCVAFPAEADPDVLEPLIGNGVVRTAKPDANLAKVGLVIKDDFTSGRTIMLSGWILSITEARVCALWCVRAQ
jgi:hypothetical protein